MDHVMIDLETLGTNPGCMILSIGAVGFDPHTNEINAGLYRNVELDQQKRLGLSIDSNTLRWWFQQSEEARVSLFNDAVEIKQALKDLRDYISQGNYRFVWSHGASFDIPILAYIYSKAKLEIPWKFWDNRDTRTLFDLAGTRMGKNKGINHHALHDAINQVEAVQIAYKKLGKAL